MGLIKLFILVFLIAILIDQSISAQMTSSDAVTTYIRDQDVKPGKTYEISAKTLQDSQVLSLKENDIVRIYQKPQLVVKNISPDRVNFIVTGVKEVFANVNETYLIVLEQGFDDLLLTVESIYNNSANVRIEAYSDKTLPKANFSELFDIDVELNNHKLPRSQDLAVYIKFINFGEGASKINIIYSIVNSTNSELYQGVDAKVVYTTDFVTKNFDFLYLPSGNYRLVATIYYGNNQTASSEKDFEVLKEGGFLGIQQSPAIIAFIVSIAIAFIFVYVLRPRIMKSTQPGQSTS